MVWMGENHFAAIPTAAYGIVLLGAAIAYTILLRAILAEQRPDSPLAIAVGKDRKGKVSLLALHGGDTGARESCRR